MVDLVNRPPHYLQGGIETIDVIESRLTKEEFVGYLKGTKMKYDLRYPFKGDIEGDLAKSEWFRHKLVATLRNEEAINPPEIEAQLVRNDDE
mgnify:FL=1|jgi:hypothetical protein